MSDNGKSYRRIKAIAQAAEMLKFLSGQTSPVSGPEIARAMDVPTATAMSQIYTLVDVDFLEASSAGFQLGRSVAYLWARRCDILKRRKEEIEAEQRHLNIGR